MHSPHRHVRTRLYFTSESHIHSLLNVLRYCNSKPGRKPAGRRGAPSGTPRSVLFPSPTRAAASALVARRSDGESKIPRPLVPRPLHFCRRAETLENIGDLDYLTHIVFRMYERFDVPAADPARFRVEILLSTGVGLDPFEQNVIAEFDAAAAEASRREKQSASPLDRARALTKIRARSPAPMPPSSRSCGSSPSTTTARTTPCGSPGRAARGRARRRRTHRTRRGEPST